MQYNDTVQQPITPFYSKMDVRGRWSSGMRSNANYGPPRPRSNQNYNQNHNYNRINNINTNLMHSNHANNNNNNMHHNQRGKPYFFDRRQRRRGPHLRNEHWAQMQCEIASLRAQVEEAWGQVQQLHGILSTVPLTPAMTPIGMCGAGLPLPPLSEHEQGIAYGYQGGLVGPDVYLNPNAYPPGLPHSPAHAFSPAPLHDGCLSPYASPYVPDAHPHSTTHPHGTLLICDPALNPSAAPFTPQYAPHEVLQPCFHPHYYGLEYAYPPPPPPGPDALVEAALNANEVTAANPSPERTAAHTALLSAIMRRTSISSPSPSPSTATPAYPSFYPTPVTSHPALSLNPTYKSHSYPELDLLSSPLRPSFTAPSPLTSLLDLTDSSSYVDTALAQVAHLRGHTVHTSALCTGLESGHA